jgi:pseudaminic acid synthase
VSNKIKIGKRMIGQGEPCFIIAEAGSNHDQKYEQAVKLIETAADAGADAVKFQVFTAGKIAADTNDRTASLKNDKFEAFGGNLHELYKKLEMPRQWLPGLQKVAAERGIIFSATPFDESAVDEMKDLNVPFYKIASFELVHLPLIKYAARTGKPVILSTGMATLKEIDEAVEALTGAGCTEYALLHCGIEYPPRMEDIHLAAMETMRQRYKCPIGYSDHTLGITVPIAAVARGAVIIEKHFTVDKNLPGPDHKFALSPEELKAMVAAIRDTEKAIGRPEKKPVEREMIYLKRGRRSLFAAVDIKKGEKITNSKLAVLRPGIGLMPKYLEEVIGKKAKTDILANEPLTWEKVEK